MLLHLCLILFTGGGLCKGGSLSRGVSVRETSCTVMRWPYASYRNAFLFSFNFNLWQKNIELSVRFYLKNKIFTSFPGPHSGEAQAYKSRPLSQPSQTTTPLSLTSVGELVVVQTCSLSEDLSPKPAHQRHLSYLTVKWWILCYRYI